jgi:uncharacterized protein (DUF488 family)
MSPSIHLFTIGFTKKSAERFFLGLRDAGVRRLIDVRLNNVSQLAGFAKRNDLQFFLKELCDIEYLHLTDLAPTQEMLDAYKKSKGSWSEYEKRFLDLIRARAIEKSLPRDIFHGGCLLCSEHQPHHCHRRVVAEYLRDQWKDVEIEHLT